LTSSKVKYIIIIKSIIIRYRLGGYDGASKVEIFSYGRQISAYDQGGGIHQNCAAGSDAGDPLP
jgi:hypothetical protein